MKKALKPLRFKAFPIGTPDAIRTHDLQSRSLTLYPAELRARTGDIVRTKVLFVKAFGDLSTAAFAVFSRLNWSVFSDF